MRVDLSSASKDERRVLEHAAGIPVSASYIDLFDRRSGLLVYLQVSGEPKGNGTIALVSEGYVAPSLSNSNAALIYILGLAQFFALNPDMECPSYAEGSVIGEIIRLLKLIPEQDMRGL